MLLLPASLFTRGRKKGRASSYSLTKTNGKSHRTWALMVLNHFKIYHSLLVFKACWVYCKSKSSHELPLEGWKQYESKKWLPVQKIELFEAIWESAFLTFDTSFSLFLGKLFIINPIPNSTMIILKDFYCIRYYLYGINYTTDKYFGRENHLPNLTP